ncbi:hypothetical protein VDG1235_2041 [Verrucomicrobiia bacterium DG1235]|nr:hypothetical protein VDG1235_2041 [Verrucomicrobiae bacterium DG1235]
MGTLVGNLEVGTPRLLVFALIRLWGVALALRGFVNIS